MVRTIWIRVSPNWVGVEGDENNVDQRRWNNSQLHELNIVLENFFQVEYSISNCEVSLPSRLAMYVVQRLNILLRLAQRGVGDNLKDDFRYGVVTECSAP